MYVSAIDLGREYTNSIKKILWRSKPKWASGHFKFWRSFQCSWLFYKSKLSKTVKPVYTALFFLVWIAQWLSRPPPGPRGPQPAAFLSPARGGSLLDSRPLVRWRYLTASSSASPSFNFPHCYLLIICSCCAGRSSSCREGRLPAGRGVRASPGAPSVAERRLRGPRLHEFRPWAQYLRLPDSRAQAQQLWCTGLVTPRHAGSSPTRDRTRVSCIGRRSSLPLCLPSSPASSASIYILFHTKLLASSFMVMFLL